MGKAERAILFPRGVLYLGKHKVEVEIAETRKSQFQGLMNRKSLADGHGMLFIYPKPARLKFWMKNTLIPLSIAFFNEERELLQILDMDVDPVLLKDNQRPRYQSKENAIYALEVPQGWFRRQGIKADPKLKFRLERLGASPKAK